jgi:DNA-binding IclR family transcriptional regulator
MDANVESGRRQRQNRKEMHVEASTAPAAEAGNAGVAPAQPTSSRARGLDRAIEIFQLLHAVRKPIPIGEIAKRLKAPRSTMYEIVNLFLAADILEYSGDGSEVFFGRAIYLYANDYFTTHAAVRLGEEEVRRLASLTGETCQLCMPVGNKYAVVAMQNSARLFRIGSDIGVLVPIPWTASGRFFVAHMTLEELTAFVPPEDFRLQDGRSMNPERFLAEARAARERGVCIISGLVDDFATCIAAPVVDHAGRCIACICFIVSTAIGEARIAELSRMLVESANKLSANPAGAGSDGRLRRP